MHYLFGQMFKLLLSLVVSWGQSSSTAIVEEPAAICSTSSTSTPLPYGTCDVFLSFRGDIRYDVADLFHRELVRAGYNTFVDVDEMEMEKDTKMKIEEAIRESEVAVVLLSDGFASSTYCLDELVEFMERHRRNETEVFPVFYKVNPDKMFTEGGSYFSAFKKREEKLRLLQGEELQKEEQRLQWHKAALQQVANVSGLVYNGSYLSSFIGKVVEEVSRFVDCSPLYVDPYLVGIDSLAEDISRWVQDWSNLIPIGLIYGPSGIGKKTIAKVVYNDNYKNFDFGIFFANVGETMKQFNGTVHLQRRLLFKIKGPTANRKFVSQEEGIVMIREAINNKRVLIVLADVDQLDQLYAIIKEPQLLKQGSKIIITSRNKDLLKGRSYMKFGVKPLSYNDAFELFCWHAFGRPYPVEGYRYHIMTALPYCCGFPFAIEALGSSMNEASPDQWEKLRRPEDIDNDKIQMVLKIVFDSMEIRDKNLFLDMVSFYIGRDKRYVDAVIEACDYYYKNGIERLIGINLVTIDEENKVKMLQPIRDFGREIARQESKDKASRLSTMCPVLQGTRDVWTFILEPSARMNNMKHLQPDNLNSSQFGMEIRTALSDVSNSGKPCLNKKSKKNLSVKPNDVTEEPINIDAIAVEQFLHNHQGCIEAMAIAMDMTELLKTIGLDHELSMAIGPGRDE